MMLSARAIFEDATENKVSTKNLKSGFGSKSENTGLKNKTNIVSDKSVSDSHYEAAKPRHNRLTNLMEDGKKCGMKSKISSSTKPNSKASESWPEVENMHIYIEPEDNYEDILPKSERIQKKEIDCLFTTCSMNRLCELTCEQKPAAELEPIEDLYNIPSSPLPYLTEDLLYDFTPLANIPPIDFLY